MTSIPVGDYPTPAEEAPRNTSIDAAPGWSPTVADLLPRLRDPQHWARWAQLTAQTGYCANPVRVLGRVSHIHLTSGEVTTGYDTTTEPDGVLLLPCRNRRATVCPTCSATYAADTWQLIAAGLRGGKGVPAGVASHPRVFATLTAPSFGPVHTTHRLPRAVPTTRNRALPPRQTRPLPCRARPGRPDGRDADLRRLLRLRRAGAVQRHRARAMGPHRHRGPPPPRRRDR